MQGIDFNWSVIFRVSEMKNFTNLIFFSIFIWSRTWFIFSIFSGRGSLCSLGDRLIFSVFFFYFNLCRSFTILEAILLILSGVILEKIVNFHPKRDSPLRTPIFLKNGQINRVTKVSSTFRPTESDSEKKWVVTWILGADWIWTGFEIACIAEIRLS